MNNIDVMYKVIEQLAIMKIPVVFKGAMVLQHILKVNNINDMYRSTADIDMNYINGNKADEDILTDIKNAIDNLHVNGLEVTQTRKSGIGKSAGFSVSRFGEKIFKLDVSIGDNPFYTDYINDNGIHFYGATKEKIYTDKIIVLSERKIFRRIKDIYDLYVLSYLEGFNIDNIKRILKFMNKDLGDFSQFIGSIQELKHAYDKYDGIQNKPEFEIMYGRVRDFCMPFIVGSYKERKGYWSRERGMWIETY